VRADDLGAADWWDWWNDVDDDDAASVSAAAAAAAAASQLPDTPSTSSSVGCGSDGVPDSPPLHTLGPSLHHRHGDVPWSTTPTDKPPTNRQSSYVPRDLLLCMTSRTAVDASWSPFVH